MPQAYLPLLLTAKVTAVALKKATLCHIFQLILETYNKCRLSRLMVKHLGTILVKRKTLSFHAFYFHLTLDKLLCLVRPAKHTCMQIPSPSSLEKAVPKGNLQPKIRWTGARWCEKQETAHED